VVARACAVEPGGLAAAGSGEDEARGRIGAALSEAAAGSGAGSHAVRVAVRGRSVDGEVQVDPHAQRALPAGEELPELAVMASGCLGLISFPRVEGRLTREAIDARWPELLDTLRGHPGIGFVLVRSSTAGPVVLGAHGEHRLESGEVIGTDPLLPFGPNAAAHVARTDGFSHCPDLVVNSTWWKDTEEVAAFEELVGSHGGMGGPQAHPFVLAPAEWAWPEEPVVGAETIHHILRAWLAEQGQEAYAPARPRASLARQG
jgi:hypothetical protein